MKPLSNSYSMLGGLPYCVDNRVWNPSGAVNNQRISYTLLPAHLSTSSYAYNADLFNPLRGHFQYPPINHLPTYYALSHHSGNSHS
jgi:hypothetical protein